jgi:hypothetical protein
MSNPAQNDDWGNLYDAPGQSPPSQDTSPLQPIFDLLKRLQENVRLLMLLFAVLLIGTIIMYAIGTPIFTAQATVGPPNPSPLNSLAATVNGASASTTGIARRLFGGGGGAGSANDPFTEYQQLLRSSRLADELVEKDKILPLVFEPEWDAQAGQWKKRGPLHAVSTSMKRFLNRPVSDHPNSYSLQLFLEKNFSLTPVINARSLSSLSMGNSYINVALSYRDRERAEKLLGIILHRADEIIRQEQLKDITARIAYIERELPTVNETAQREALIDILSGQEQLRMMMVADKRFAYTMIDTPHASPKPTSPASPTINVVITAFLSLIIWVLLVLCEPKVPFLQKWMPHLRRS